MSWCSYSRCCGDSPWKVFFLVLFLIGYLCLGAGIFHLIEISREDELVTELREVRSALLDKVRTCISDEELERFIVSIITGANRGVSSIRNVTMSESNWSFGQSLFFASTVLTTIGYGRVTPLSDAGKGFCIMYAVIGIPLTLIMFTAVVERLMIPVAKLSNFMLRKLGHLYKVFHIRMMHLAIVITIVFIFFFLIPAAIYTALEPGWNYLDAFYYCFISMTTIGLGDYIPGDYQDQSFRALYKVCTTAYLLLGLIMMMLWLAVLYEIPELNIGLHFYLKSEDDDDERVRLRPPESPSGPKYTQSLGASESGNHDNTHIEQ